MAMLVHEVWDDRGLLGVCLAGPNGEDFRKLLSTDARCIRHFEAESHFEAMSIYYRLDGWGNYTSDLTVDREPYPDAWAERQSVSKSE